MRGSAAALIFVGAAAAVFGAMWLTIVFPGFKEIPKDYKQAIDFQGTYAVVADQDFVQRLLSNPALQQLVSSPEALQLLAGPEVQALLAGGAGEAVLGDPTTVQLLLRPDVQRLLAGPIPPPAGADPEVLATLADPAVQQLLASPELLQLLTNPIVATLLTNPVTRRVLASPEALGLMAHPRTLQLLADPAGLKLDVIPVNFHRVREAERTEGDTIFLHQDFLATVLGSGQALPQFSSTATLAVDRKSREYVAGGTEPRTGGFAFPSGVKKDRQYPIWVHEVFDAPLAGFVESGEVDGLEVLTFQISEQALPLPAEPKRTLGIPENLELTADVEMTTRTEPRSGITVDVVSSVSYRVDNPSLGNPKVFEGSIRYSDASVATSIDDARDARRLIFWVGVFLPWTALGLGILLIAAGGAAQAGVMRAKPGA